MMVLIGIARHCQACVVWPSNAIPACISIIACLLGSLLCSPVERYE